MRLSGIIPPTPFVIPSWFQVKFPLTPAQNSIQPKNPRNFSADLKLFVLLHFALQIGPTLASRILFFVSSTQQHYWILFDFLFHLMWPRIFLQGVKWELQDSPWLFSFSQSLPIVQCLKTNGLMRTTMKFSELFIHFLEIFHQSLFPNPKKDKKKKHLSQVFL